MSKEYEASPANDWELVEKGSVVRCEACGGSGEALDSEGWAIDCAECEGKGFVALMQMAYDKDTQTILGKPIASILETREVKVFDYEDNTCAKCNFAEWRHRGIHPCPKFERKTAKETSSNESSSKLANDTDVVTTGGSDAK